MVTEDELKTLDATYRKAIATAERARATAIANAITEGWTQKDVIAATGYSRETVRRLTHQGQTALATDPADQQ